MGAMFSIDIIQMKDNIYCVGIENGMNVGLNAQIMESFFFSCVYFKNEFFKWGNFFWFSKDNNRVPKFAIDDISLVDLF